MNKSGLSTLTRVLILTAFYVVGGIAGKAFAFLSGTVVLVWPPFGIALGGLLLFGNRFWPGVALGAGIFALVSGETSILLVISTVVGTTAGALVCSYLLERFIKFNTALERVRDVAGFVGLACALGTTVTALFHALSLSLVGKSDWDDLFSTVLEWWVPNAMAGLVVAPLILTFGTRSSITWRPALTLEAVICALGLIAGTMVSFNSWFVYGIQKYPLAYLPFPFLVWGALRFGPRGAASGTLVVAVLSMYALLDQRGPFVAHTQRESLMLIGTYISVLAITNLMLSGATMERDIAERAVRESERRYRAVVEDQTDLISRFDAKGILTFVNDAYCRFHNKRREELLGAYFLANIPEADREIPLHHFNALTKDNAVVTFDYKVSPNQSEVIWHACTIRRIFDQTGQTLEFQSVVQDITRRKNAEDSFRRGEERLRLILMSQVDAVIVLDHTENVTSFNLAAERMFQQPATNAVGQPLKSLFGACEMIAYRECLNLQSRQSKVKILETELVRANGTRLPIDMAATEVKLEAHSLFIIVMREISERKRLEADIRQSQKMEAVGRLAGGISHDFNNIMQAIVAYTHLLQDSLDPTHPDHEMVLQIEKSAERASTLTNHLLAFSRKQVMQMKLISLNTVVQDIGRLLKRLIGENIQLDLRLQEHLGVVKADPTQIGQVILNLALNARDAMPYGGVLIIRTENMELNDPLPGFDSSFQPGHYVCLTVTDSGVGMTEEVRGHLFEPFFTTKEIGKGTGLGLSIVFGVVKQSGGEIIVNTSLGKGTSFQIFLPQQQGQAETDAMPVPKPIVGGNETILLVEDGDAVREVISDVLNIEGYSILQARNGEEALEIVNNTDQPIDLVISDMIMPKMGGRELAARLSTTHPRLPILFISGFSGSDNGDLEAVENSPNFLHKPFRPDVLLTKIRSALNARETI